MGQGKADGPPPPAGRPRAGSPRAGSQSSLRRERHQGPARRTVSRAELASRYAGFADVSPEVGELDADALAGMLAADPDAAAALLADLSQATDASLRAVARQLAVRSASGPWYAAMATSTWTGRSTGSRARGRRPPRMW